MSWQSASLGDCIELVSGAAFKSAMFTDNPDDIPLVKGENIGQGEILWDKSRYWPATQFDEYLKLVLKPDDIVLAMDRPWVTAGLKYAIISDRDPVSLLVQRVARIRPLANADAKFLKHIVGSKSFLEYIKGIMGGTNVPHISGRQIRDYKCRLPDIETQQRISSVLSAYDDLIENNRRRIALLEEAARRLYKEWFVRFRFPGHEHVKIIDGVPEGWEPTRLGDIAVTNESSYSAKNLPEHVRYIDISAVNRGEIIINSPIASEEAPGRARRIANHGDVIWSNVRPNLRAYALVMHPDEIDVFSTGFTVLSSAFLPYSFLYLHTTTDAFVNYLVNHTTGASYPAVRPDDFERAEMFAPPRNLLSAFHEQCEPNFEMMAVLRKKIEQLAKARDLLLPKLMSGAITV